MKLVSTEIDKNWRYINIYICIRVYYISNEKICKEKKWEKNTLRLIISKDIQQNKNIFFYIACCYIIDLTTISYLGVLKKKVVCFKG